MSETKKAVSKRRIKLALIDILLLIGSALAFLVFFPGSGVHFSTEYIVLHVLLCTVWVMVWRIVGGSYSLVWRYGHSNAYLQMIVMDVLAGATYFTIQHMLFPVSNRLSIVRASGIILLNSLATVMIRHIYQFLYEYNGSNQLILALIKASEPITRFSRNKSVRGFRSTSDARRRIRVAIVGAGRVGVSLAEELMSNQKSNYDPVCFIDIDDDKIGRKINGIPVLPAQEATMERLSNLSIQEIVFALPKVSAERKKTLYDYYKVTGCKIKAYDYPVAQSLESGKRQLRDFDVEDLLFRESKDFVDETTRDYYRGKRVLITGGGGSIGSELGRQIAQMEPAQLIILDVYENCAYDLQQELRIQYGSKLNLAVEIVTITDRDTLEAVFAKYRPEVVIHAAAHKHVPLMEHNCVEAVKNNVFGTLNVVDCCEKYGVEKAVMVSTDKAVNPTNVMGATKRMCEMIFQSRVDSETSFSCTRFGNVLGSNGSVIPLFKRQIANGGPVTLTDKRIIRYFMTIPEASQLVLNSGAMARHGDLFVLDMGKPVKILELAESMIRLSGFEPYKDIDIIETGLRPGEKLYEELLIKTESLDKTANDMIFVERDKPLSRGEIQEKLNVLKNAVATCDDDACKAALKSVVPTFRSPAQVNKAAERAEEMKLLNEKHDMAAAG